MTTLVSNGDKNLQPRLMANSLLLHQPDFQNLTLEGYPQGKANNLGLLDGQREKTDLSQGLALCNLDSAS